MRPAPTGAKQLGRAKSCDTPAPFAKPKCGGPGGLWESGAVAFLCNILMERNLIDLPWFLAVFGGIIVSTGYPTPQAPFARSALSAASARGSLFELTWSLLYSGRPLAIRVWTAVQSAMCVAVATPPARIGFLNMPPRRGWQFVGQWVLQRFRAYGAGQPLKPGNGLESAYTKRGAPGVVLMTIDNMIVLEAAV